MRDAFARAVVEVAKGDERVMFLTGDLGYKALEPVQVALGSRFLNCGIAEQNMVSVAAGLASKGFLPIIYSIAPFVTLRPYEQIRNDICHHSLSVKIVGNGGGYGYGIMGKSHHAIEDIGAMRLLPGMHIFVPTFEQDVSEAVSSMISQSGPSYLRLGRSVSALKEYYTPFSQFRRIQAGEGVLILCCGPVLDCLSTVMAKEVKEKVEVWVVGELPFKQLPDDLREGINRIGRILVIEEHVQAGGIAECFALAALGHVQRPIHFRSLHAVGYPSGRYGSQAWHLKESGMDSESVYTIVKELLKSDE